MTSLRIVGGTDMGDTEAPAVWDDEAEGAARVVRMAMSEVSNLCGVIVIGAYADRNELFIASSFPVAELAVGFLERAKTSLVAHSIMSPDIEEYEDDGA